MIDKHRWVRDCLLENNNDIVRAKGIAWSEVLVQRDDVRHAD
jgi:hypothetical protein